MDPSATISVHIDNSPAVEAAFEAIGEGIARGVVHIDRIRPVDRTSDFFAAVAAIHGTDTPLVHTSREVSPFNVDVDGVGHPNGGQQNGVINSVRSVVVAIRTIHSVVVE